MTIQTMNLFLFAGYLIYMAIGIENASIFFGCIFRKLSLVIQFGNFYIFTFGKLVLYITRSRVELLGSANMTLISALLLQIWTLYDRNINKTLDPAVNNLT